MDVREEINKGKFCNIKHEERSLILFSAFFHDIGKLWSYKKENYFEDSKYIHTEEEELLGHSHLGASMIHRKANDIGFPKRMALYIEHIIASHHLKKEWGALATPKNKGAFLVFLSDYKSAFGKKYEKTFEELIDLYIPNNS